MTLATVERLPEDAGLERAIRDGIARGYDGAVARGAPWYALLPRAGRWARSWGCWASPAGPAGGAVTLVGVAIDPAKRGRELGTRAVRIAERRLRREGVTTFYGRAPRGNGRGLYFWLRAGFTPVPSPRPDDDATWFRLPRRQLRGR